MSGRKSQEPEEDRNKSRDRMSGGSKQTPRPSSDDGNITGSDPDSGNGRGTSRQHGSKPDSVVPDSRGGRMSDSCEPHRPKASTGATHQSPESNKGAASHGLQSSAARLPRLPEETVQHELCFLCGQLYADPRLLPCYHTFCLGCLEEYVQYNVKDDVFPCALCKSPVCTLPGGVKEFPRNCYVENRRSKKERVKCDLCGDRAAARAFCHECNQNLCGYCTNFHEKLQASRHHQVTSIDDSGARKLRSRPRCPEHAQKELEYFCEECQHLLCIDCNMTNHKAHKTRGASDVVDHFREQLTALLTDARYEDHVTSLLESKNKPDARDETSREEDQLIRDIESQHKLICECLDQIKTNLISDVLEATERHAEHARKRKQAAATDYQSFAAVYFLSKMLLQEGNDLDIIHHAQGLKSRLNQMEQQGDGRSSFWGQISTPTFIPGHVDREALSTMLGKFSGGEGASELVARLTGKFLCSPGDGVVSSIAPSVPGHPGGRAWVSVSNEAGAKEYDIEGTCCRQVAFSHGVDDMIWCQETLFATSNGAHYIRTVDSEGQKRVLTTTPLCPRGICRSPSEDSFVISMVKNDAFFAASSSDEFSIVEMSSLAEERKIYSPPPLAYPARLTMTSQYLFVSDWLQGAVFILNSAGEVQGRYPDNGSELAPRGICCDSQDCVYVVDIATECVHVLKPDGKFQGLLSFGGVKVRQPWSISCDTEDNLWVGSQDATVYLFSLPERQ